MSQVSYNKKWRAKNSEKFKAQQKNYHYIKKYGISQTEYDRLFVEQGGSCKICGTHQSELKARLAVDHCHKTNRVRSLLCGNCNSALGLVKEDISIIQKMIVYIQLNNRR